MNDADLETTTRGTGVFGFRIPLVWLVAGGGWIGRIIQVIAQLVAVRILIQGLGTQGYGVFAVLASLSGWLLLSDFSIGISVQNYISERRAKSGEIGDIVLTGAILSLVSATIVCFAMLLLGPWLSRLLLDGFSFLSASQRTLAFYAMAFPAVGTALGGVLYRIWFGQQRGYLSNLLPAAGTVIGTAAVWALKIGQGGPQLALSVFLYYAPLAILPMLLLLVTTARAARTHRFRIDLIKPLLTRAYRFWISGLLAAAVLQVDYIVMVRVLPVKDIVIYNVATKLFLLIFFVYNALLLALWPVCSEAGARNDWHAIRAIVRKYIMIGMGFTLAAGIGVAITNHWIVRVLAPGLDTPIPFIIVGLLTFYTMVRVWTDMFSVVLQSINDIKILWVVALVQALLSASLQTLGARLFGLPGMIVGLITCFLLTAAWVLPLRCRSHADAVPAHI